MKLERDICAKIGIKVEPFNCIVNLRHDKDTTSRIFDPNSSNTFEKKNLLKKIPTSKGEEKTSNFLPIFSHFLSFPIRWKFYIVKMQSLYRTIRY